METRVGQAAEPQAASGDSVEVKNVFVDFLFFKLKGEYRQLPDKECKKGASEFLATLKKEKTSKDIRTYLTLGLKKETDFLLWLIADDLEEVPKLLTAIYKTGIGKYLELAYSFVAMTKTSPYSKKHQQNFMLGPSKYKYLFVYPFMKTSEWYCLPLEERRRMMTEHSVVGNEFPMVKLNTTYSFGLGDDEFVLAFETDSPKDFSDLVQRLRETASRKYTLKDTPLIPCINKTPEEIIEALGL